MYRAGTVRPNRKHLPKSEVPADKSMEMGEVAAYQAGKIQFVKWMDNKSVHMLSNFLSAYPLTQLKRRKKGSKTKQEVSCPAIVKCYNEHMGGEDIVDQKKVTYQFDHCSHHKYYFRLVHDLIDIGVKNACVDFNKLQCARADQLDGKTFRRMVARSLIANFSSKKRLSPTAAVATPK